MKNVMNVKVNCRIVQAVDILFKTENVNYVNKSMDGLLKMAYVKTYAGMES